MQSEVNQEENLNRIITVPNLLSFFRLCLIPVIIWSYCVKKNPLLAGEILLLSGLTDLADGYIARRFHMISNLGKILDPVADKLTQAAMLICYQDTYCQINVFAHDRSNGIENTVRLDEMQMEVVSTPQSSHQ